MLCGLECERKTLLTSPWLMFFRAPVAPAAWWSLTQGRQDDLVEPLGHDPAQVGAVAPVVLRVLPPADERQLDEFVGVVAGDRVLGIELDRQLAGVPGDRGQAPVGDAIGQDLLVTGLAELEPVAVEDDHVLELDPGRLEAVDHLQDQLGRGVGPGIAVGHDLDADRLPRLDEGPPGLDGMVRRRSGR